MIVTCRCLSVDVRAHYKILNQTIRRRCEVHTKNRLYYILYRRVLSPILSECATKSSRPVDPDFSFAPDNSTTSQSKTPSSNIKRRPMTLSAMFKSSSGSEDVSTFHPRRRISTGDFECSPRTSTGYVSIAH